MSRSTSSLLPRFFRLFIIFVSTTHFFFFSFVLLVFVSTAPSSSDTKRWRRDRLENIFLPFEVETILNIPISFHLPDDSIIWVGNKKGYFSIKSAYYVARRILEKEDHGESSLGDVCAPLWKRIWHLNILEKIRIFAWKLCMNAIPTLTNLFKKGIQTEVTCPINKKEAESVEHAILRCDSAKAVWAKWIDCPVISQHVSVSLFNFGTLT